jgi:hypothetical protein
MRYKYVVILRNDRDRALDPVSIFLCLFCAGIFFHSGFQGVHPDYVSLTFAALLLIGIVVNLSLARRRPTVGYKRAAPVRYRYLLLLCALGCFVLTTAPLLGATFVLIVILEYQAKRPLEIGFDDDRVVINNIIRQQYDWSAFNNVILKDGLLTLDFKTNRLLQKAVADDDDEDDAEEEEFNAFCRSRLLAAARVSA